MSLEQALLEAVGCIGREQQEVLNHAADSGDEAGGKIPFKSVKGLWADLGISLSARRIEENRRDMSLEFPHGRHLMAWCCCRYTHHWFWYLSAAPAIGKCGRRSRLCDSRWERIYVPSICLVELTTCREGPFA